MRPLLARPNQDKLGTMRALVPTLVLSAALATACGGDEFASEASTGGAAGSSGSGATGASGGAGGTGAGGATGGTAGTSPSGGSAGSAGTAPTGGTGGTGGATGGTGGTGGTTGGTGGTGTTSLCVPKGGTWTIAENSLVKARYSAIADGYIYWSTPNRIYRNTTGGTPASAEILYQGGTDVAGIAVAGGDLYHADPGAGVVRHSVIGVSGSNQVAVEALPETVAVDAFHVYWAAKDGIRRRSRSLGANLVEPLYPSAGAYALALDGNDVVWVTLGGLVYRAPKSGGASVTPLHSHTTAGIFTTVSIAVDPGTGNVYWTYTTATGGGGVFVVPASGQPQHIQSQPGADAVTFSAGCIYWSVFNPGGSGMRARPKVGGTIEAFQNAGSNNRPRGLIAHTDALYWVDYVTGNVMKRFW